MKLILLSAFFLSAQTLLAEPIIGAYPAGTGKVVSVVYASERSIRGGVKPREYFGNERAPLHFGVCDIGIPPKHNIGNLEAPKWLSSWDPSKHIVFSVLELHDQFLTATEQVRTKNNLDDIHDVFVFIHGYGNSFESACRRTAQMWSDLDLTNSVPVVYTWASMGKLTEYDEDLSTVNEWTNKYLSQFLSGLPVIFKNQRIHLVTHSMGSRPLMEALYNIGSSPIDNTRKPFDQVVLFAPEIPTIEFQKLLPNARLTANRISLYASSDDEALSYARRFLHNTAPAGDLNSSPSRIAGIDIIDATGVDYTMDGHGYYANNRVVISDLREVLRGKAATERGEITGMEGGRYLFRP